MAELPGVQRETLDVDVVIVGAGPAGLAAAYHLSKLIKAHNETSEKKIDPISIAVLEKGKEIGSHGISGAVMDPRGIADLIPDWLERGCPVESAVIDDGDQPSRPLEDGMPRPPTAIASRSARPNALAADSAM